MNDVPANAWRRLTPDQIAQACGITLKYERLPLLFGKIILFGEAFFDPPVINLNVTAINAVVQAAQTQMPRQWFTAAIVTKVVFAHELYHLLTHKPTTPANEKSAHAFAQQITGLPFSPERYTEILKQATECQITKHII